jgi:hypothetical protein
MAGSRSSTRIGATERAEAQQALQAHLNAGRLQVDEYADRSAAASAAVTAPELAVLFTDLPRPHPKLPGSRFGGTRNLALIGGAVVLALLGLFAFAFGGGAAPVPVPVPTPAVSRPNVALPPPTTSAARSATTPRASAEESAALLADGATVRRSTGTQVITLRPSYGVDLDDAVSPNWSVGQGCCNRDVGWTSDAARLNIANDYAVMTGTPDYTACAQETGYTDGSIERGSLQVGQNLCLRTSGHRYALVTIVDVSDQGVQFRATVWDPPFAS